MPCGVCDASGRTSMVRHAGGERPASTRRAAERWLPERASTLQGRKPREQAGGRVTRELEASLEASNEASLESWLEAWLNESLGKMEAREKAPVVKYFGRAFWLGVGWRDGTRERTRERTSEQRLREAVPVREHCTATVVQHARSLQRTRKPLRASRARVCGRVGMGVCVRVGWQAGAWHWVRGFSVGLCRLGFVDWIC